MPWLPYPIQAVFWKHCRMLSKGHPLHFQRTTGFRVIQERQDPQTGTVISLTGAKRAIRVTEKRMGEGGREGRKSNKCNS